MFRIPCMRLRLYISLKTVVLFVLITAAVTVSGQYLLISGWFSEKQAPCRVCLHYEESASWESKSDSELWNSRVRDSVLSGTSSEVHVNSLCSEELFTEIKDIREKVFSIIENQNARGFSTCQSLFSLSVFEKTSLFLNFGSNGKIISAIERHMSLGSWGMDFDQRGLSSTAPVDRLINALLNTAVIVPSSNPHEKIKAEAGGSSGTSDRYMSNLKVGTYLWDRGNIDSYRLYLYIKDNTSGISTGNKYNTPSFMFFTHFFRFHYNSHITATLKIPVRYSAALRKYKSSPCIESALMHNSSPSDPKISLTEYLYEFEKNYFCSYSMPDSCVFACYAGQASLWRYTF